MSLPNLSSLASGLKLSPTPIGAIVTVVPPLECPLCYEPVYECEQSSEQVAQRRRVGDDGEQPPRSVWPDCPHAQWSVVEPVAVLNGCGHSFHKRCIESVIRARLSPAEDPLCPICRHTIYEDECDEFMEVVDGPESSHIDRHPLDGGEIGDVRYYEGPQGRRRMVRAEVPEGAASYEGPKGSEHWVRWESFTNGKIEDYEGPKGGEYLVRITHPDGREELFEEGQVRLFW